MRLDPVDARLDWRGVVEFERVSLQWWQPWRLPSQGVPSGLGNLADRARDAAGVRLVAGAGVKSLAMRVRGHPEAPLDIIVNGSLADRIRLRGERTISAPSGGEIWLPQFGHLQVGPIEVDGTPHANQHGVRWTTYGSSITQCRGAEGPSETWPALVARSTGWNVTALGFGGECHLDQIAADTIRDRPAEIISLCLGVNIHGHSTFSERTLAPAILAFVDRIRACHSAPLLIIGPIASPPNEHRGNAVGLTLEQVREQVRLSAESAGTAYFDGRELVSDQDAELLADGIHPTPTGYRRIAERIQPVLEAMLTR